jgi:hypothetical protein
MCGGCGAAAAAAAAAAMGAQDRCVVPFAGRGRDRRIPHVFGSMVDESKIATESMRSFLTSRLSFFTGLTVPSNAPAEFSYQASKHASTKSPPACKHTHAPAVTTSVTVMLCGARARQRPP